jgi:hypothetical protein
MKTTKYFYIAAAICILSLFPFGLSADPTDPPIPPAAGGGGVPIDGGIGWLLAAGIGYGAKKFYDAKKTPTKNSID